MERVIRMKLNMTKEQFIEKYYTTNNQDLARELNININNFYQLVKQLNLKKQRGPRKKVEKFEFIVE